MAEFPATLFIGASALETINNKPVRCKGKREINQRALMAVHTTSSSCEDFRLTCSLLDIKPPDKDMSKTQLNKILEAFKCVEQELMRFEGQHVHSCAPIINETGTGVRECAVNLTLRGIAGATIPTKNLLLQ